MIILEVLKGIFTISIVFGGIFVILIVLWSIIVILEDLKIFWLYCMFEMYFNHFRSFKHALVTLEILGTFLSF